jgi:ABC-type sugar transport system substrate-binding protein
MGTRWTAWGLALAALALAVAARAEEDESSPAAFAFDLQNPVFERMLERAVTEAKPLLLDFYLPG